jgi:hypothetical protein
MKIAHIFTSFPLEISLIPPLCDIIGVGNWRPRASETETDRTHPSRHSSWFKSLASGAPTGAELVTGQAPTADPLHLARSSHFEYSTDLCRLFI